MNFHGTFSKCTSMFVVIDDDYKFLFTFKLVVDLQFFTTSVHKHRILFHSIIYIQNEKFIFVVNLKQSKQIIITNFKHFKAL